MGSVLSSNLTTPGMSFAVALRGKKEEHQQPRAHQVAGTQCPCGFTPTRTAENGSVSSGPKCNSLKAVVTVVQQIMTESNWAMLEEAKIWSLQKLS
jgi:hypothetical protein